MKYSISQTWSFFLNWKCGYSPSVMEMKSNHLKLMTFIHFFGNLVNFQQDSSGNWSNRSVLTHVWNVLNSFGHFFGTKHLHRLLCSSVCTSVGHSSDNLFCIAQIYVVGTYVKHFHHYCFLISFFSYLLSNPNKLFLTRIENEMRAIIKEMGFDLTLPQFIEKLRY